jgi:hypothetical protein
MLTIALQEQRIQVADDRDFGELVFRQRQAHAGVIFFRLPPTELDVKIARLAAVLADHSHELNQFLTVTELRIRVRGPRAEVER